MFAIICLTSLFLKMYISHLRRLMPALCFHYTKSIFQKSTIIFIYLSRLYESFINCKFICSILFLKKQNYISITGSVKRHICGFKRLSRFPKNLGFDLSPFKKCRIFLSILHFLHDKPLINYTFKISFTISFILSESHSLLCLI